MLRSSIRSPLTTPHIQLKQHEAQRANILASACISHHCAEYNTLSHMRHLRRSRGRVVHLPRLPFPCPRNEAYKPHKSVTAVPVPLNDAIPATPSLDPRPPAPTASVYLPPPRPQGPEQCSPIRPLASSPHAQVDDAVALPQAPPGRR